MIKLLLSFLKIGFFTFGGGYAMIPLIEEELVAKQGIIDSHDFVDMISVAQSFPGPIAVNLSLLIGYRLYGHIGGLICCFGAVFPSFISILLLAWIYSIGKSLDVLDGFFYGVRPVMVSLLACSFLALFKKMNRSHKNIALLAISFLLVTLFDVNPIFIIIAGGVMSIWTN